MRKKVTGAVVVLSTMLLFSAPAIAERFSGQSTQSKPVNLWTQPNGKVRRFEIKWKTNDCDPSGRMAPRWTAFIKPFDRSRRGFFADRGRYHVDYTDADVRFKTAVRGRQQSERRWRGWFRIKAFIDREDGPSNECALRRTRWSAKVTR